MEDFEKSKAFLKQSGPNGQSLYDHLTDTILHIVKEKPADSLAQVCVRLTRAAVLSLPLQQRLTSTVLCCVMVWC